MRNPQLEYQQQSVKNASPLQLVVKMYDLAIQATYSKDENGVMVDMNNRKVLDAFTGAISETFADEARASIFNVYSNNVQFSIQSLQSESEGAFELSGATGALAGITDPMTKLVPDAANLDVHFTIDGVTFLRSENIVDDAITGLSFTLRGETCRYRLSGIWTVSARMWMILWQRSTK